MRLIVFAELILKRSREELPEHPAVSCIARDWQGRGPINILELNSQI